MQQSMIDAWIDEIGSYLKKRIWDGEGLSFIEGEWYYKVVHLNGEMRMSKSLVRHSLSGVDQPLSVEDYRIVEQRLVNTRDR